jgi:TP901 family phage tail tape measure protein
MSLLGNAAVITIGAVLASSYYSTFSNAESTAVKLGAAYKQTQDKLAAVNSIGKYEKQLGMLDARYKSGKVDADIYAKVHETLHNKLFAAKGAATTLGLALDKLGQSHKKLTFMEKYQGMRVSGIGMYNTAKAGIKQNWLEAAGAVGTIGLPVKIAADFEQSMSRVKAIVGATDSEFKTLSQTARQLGRSSEFGSSGVAAGMFSLAQQGYKTNQIIGMMPGLLNLASAGMTELGETSAIAGNILFDFSLKAGQMTHVADVLAKTFTSCGTNLQELGEAMANVGPLAASLNISLEQTAAFLGFLSKAGVKGAAGGAALRSMLTGLVKETGEGAQMLRQLDVEARDLDGNLRPLGDVMADLSRGLSYLGDAERLEALSAIFGARAAEKLTKVFGEGSVAEINRFTEALKKCDGAAKEIGKVNDENFWGSVKILKSELTDIGISIGQVLLPVLRVFAEIIAFVLVPIGNFIEANNVITSTVVWVASGLLMLTKVFPLVALGIRLITGAMMTNPIGLIIGLIAIGLGLIIQYWDPIVEGIMWVVDAIGTALGYGWEAVKFLFFFTNPIGIAIKAIDYLVNKIDILGKAWKWVKGLFGFGEKTAMPEIGSAIKSASDNAAAQNPDNTDANAAGEKRARELARQTQESSPAMAASRVSSQKQINNNQTITIHTQPGQSPEEIAEMVLKRQQQLDEQNEQGAMYDHELSFA